MKSYTKSELTRAAGVSPETFRRWLRSDRAFLEANGIRCILEDHTMWAVTSHYSGIGGDMRILVTEADKEQATQLINNKD